MMAHRRGRGITQPFHSSVRSSHWLITVYAAVSITCSVICFVRSSATRYVSFVLELFQGTWGRIGKPHTQHAGRAYRTWKITSWYPKRQVGFSARMSQFLMDPIRFSWNRRSPALLCLLRFPWSHNDASKKADLGGTYFMTCGISVRCAAKQPRNTAANFVSFGIIVIHCPKQARAAFANLVAMAVIVLDRTKKPGRLVIFFFVIVKFLLSCLCFFSRNQEWLWMGR